MKVHRGQSNQVDGITVPLVTCAGNNDYLEKNAEQSASVFETRLYCQLCS